MTAIIGIRRGDKITIVADGVSTRGDWEAMRITSPSNYKIQQINGSDGCFVASTGTCAALNIVTKIPNLLEGKDDVTFEDMVLKVVPRIFSHLDERGMLEKSDDVYIAPGAFLITTKTRMFVIQSTGFVREHSSVAVLGSGAQELMCRYSAMIDTEMDDEARGVDAMKFTIKYNRSIMYPICVASNQMGSIKCYEKGTV